MKKSDPVALGRREGACGAGGDGFCDCCPDCLDCVHPKNGSASLVANRFCDCRKGLEVSPDYAPCWNSCLDCLGDDGQVAYMPGDVAAACLGSSPGAAHEIVVTAHSSMGGGANAMKAFHASPPLVDDAALNAIATKHGATPQAVLLAWGLQRPGGPTAIIPKSVSAARIAANLDDTLKLTLDADDLALGDRVTIDV